MASVKVKFRPSSIVGREGSVYYQIIHERKIRQLISDYKVYPTEWSEKRSMVIQTASDGRRPVLMAVYERIRCDMERFNRIIRRFDNNGLTYTADDIVDEFSRYVREYTLFRFMEDIIAKLRDNGKVRTSETYTAALRSFKAFICDLKQRRALNKWADVMLDSIDTEIIESYEAWLRNRGVATNTISFYTRILRAVYNRAVDHGIIENRNPFRHVYTGVDKTVKRALPVKILKKIRWLDLTASPALDYARDMFML
ncbi:MAG: phage integrase SAM-like domain-containing protein, partial [Muribaculaceae bacterium]|nr:phage integrase SAM-like domain-containing protein [Muribaculaceae bacterium]